MSVSLSQTPSNLRINIFTMEFDSSAAVQGLPEVPSKALIIAGRTASGTAAAGEKVRVFTDGQARDLFGAGSQAHLMSAAFFKNNLVTDLSVIALDDPGSATPARASIQCSLSAPEAGTLFLYIGGVRVPVAVQSSDDDGALAAAIEARINAARDLPVTASATGGTVELTAKNAGEGGNDISIIENYYRGESTPAGVTLTFPARLAGGAGNPDVSVALAAIGDEVFTDIAFPYLDQANLTLIKDEMADRWGPVRGALVYGGTVYASANGSVGQLSTLGSLHNSPHLCIPGVQNSPVPHWVQSALFCGVVARDAAIDPARPFQTLPVRGLLAPAEKNRFDWRERNALLYDGISTLTFDPDGTARIERVITTYQTNPAGEEDIAYLDLNTIKTLLYYRHSLLARFRRKFPRHKLAGDADRFQPDQPIMTPNLARAEIISHYLEMIGAGLTENLDAFKKALIVERDPDNPSRLLASISPDVINQFRQFAAKAAFIL